MVWVPEGKEEKMAKSKGFAVGAALAVCVAFLIPSNLPTPIKSPAAVTVSAISDEGVRVSSRIWELLFSKDAQESTEEIYLVPGGGVFGARLKREHLAIEDAGEIKGVDSGDLLLKVNGTEVHTAKDVTDAVKSASGKSVTLTLSRSGRQFEVKATPKCINNSYSLGITLRDSAAGIGTITYIDPQTGSFGGLGHGICDAESKLPIEIDEGQVTGVILGGVQKGAAGKPGELSGILTDKLLGEVHFNTDSGVFGTLAATPSLPAAIPIGRSTELHEGEATIISTVKNGKRMEYSVKIFQIEKDTGGTKCFKIKVTDPTLIALTGGIVKGMSGSPIIQNGKLVGAVTHVMINDPTEGYGIFIENMLSASNAEIQPKAA